MNFIYALLVTIAAVGGSVGLLNYRDRYLNRVYEDARTLVRRRFRQRGEWAIEDILKHGHIPEDRWQNATILLETIATEIDISPGFIRVDDCLSDMFRVFRDDVKHISDEAWTKARVRQEPIDLFSASLAETIELTFLEDIGTHFHNEEEYIHFIVSRSLNDVIMFLFPPDEDEKT